MRKMTILNRNQYASAEQRDNGIHPKMETKMEYEEKYVKECSVCARFPIARRLVTSEVITYQLKCALNKRGFTHPLLSHQRRLEVQP